MRNLTYVLGENIAAVLLVSEMDDERIRDMLASPLYLQEREASADPPRVYNSKKRKLFVKRFQATAGGPLLRFHTRESRVKSLTPTEMAGLWPHGQSKEKMKQCLCTSEHRTRILLEEQRDQLLSEAKSEIMKQECRVEFADGNIRDLNRRIQSHSMEIDHTNIGYEQARREQARLHEDLAERERACRETHIRSIREMEDLKRAQELRVDEFSRRRLIKNQVTINELINCMSDLKEFQDVESFRSGRLSHVPSPLAVVPSLRGMLSRDPRL